MMTTIAIRTIEDLVRILDDNPEWREALRARLLTRELLEMPNALAKFVEETRLRFDENDVRASRMERDIQRLKDDVGILKGAHARNAAARDYGWMTRNMGLKPARILPVDEVDELALRLMDDGVSQGDIQSFRKADMIIEAADARGDTCHIAVEVSFKVDERDTGRAMRNAEYLAKLTDKPARAAVIGATFDYRVRDLMDSGEVHWHPLSEKDLQAD